MSSDHKKLLIVIPAYNEEKNILQTIDNVKKHCNFDYVVIEDCSKDHTLDVLKNNNINYIHHEINKGLSGAIRTGIAYALNNQYDYVIQIDGDNQHNPDDIVKFYELANDENDVIIGNRYLTNKKGSSLKSFAQSLISTFFKWKTKVKLIDPTNGMRLYGKTFMKRYVDNENLMVEPSSIAYLTKHYNLNIKQVHTTVFERQNGQSMYNKRWKQLKYILREVTRMLPGNEHWVNKKKEDQ